MELALQKFEENKETRDYLAHGYTIAYTADGTVSAYLFSMYEWPKQAPNPTAIDKLVTPAEFRTLAKDTIAYGKTVYAMIKRIYDDLALESDADPK